ncbi:10-deacetylbaccatin III 10-O-acetyltransferase [Hordeum vulgare]|nr:10-deacetylbaccatin III 10-O-acetyltransferase [Hordeum vulgare]
MSIVVTKSSSVAVTNPPELGTLTGSIINLSFDKCFAPVPVHLLLVFDQPINDPVQTVKKAVSMALVHYHPMAGRLVAGADDRELIHIACTGEGVSFVDASASCTRDQVSTSPLLVRDLTLHYPADYCRPAKPLLLMQVTEFACGGFTVGVTWNHVVADGAGMAQFLQAVGELARGMPAPSVVPIRAVVDRSLPCLPPEVVTAIVGCNKPQRRAAHVRRSSAGKNHLAESLIVFLLVSFLFGSSHCTRGERADTTRGWKEHVRAHQEGVRSPGELGHCVPHARALCTVIAGGTGFIFGLTAMRSQMTILDATVPWSLISRIKRECSGECTTFDAVAALFWQCHTRAVVISDPDTPAPLFFPSSMRWLLGAAKHGYYGNCVMRQPVQAKSGTVASGDVKGLVKLIRLAKRKKIPGMLTITNGGGGGGGSGTETPPPRYNTLVVTSLRNLGLDLDVVDLGRGSPARVMPPAWKTERTASCARRARGRTASTWCPSVSSRSMPMPSLGSWRPSVYAS